MVFGSYKRDAAAFSNGNKVFGTGQLKGKSQNVFGSVGERKTQNGNHKNLFVNSYLLKGGGLLKSPISTSGIISDDFTLIHEVDNFIA